MLALLQHGADVRMINAEGNSAFNVARTADIKSVIEGSYCVLAVFRSF